MLVQAQGQKGADRARVYAALEQRNRLVTILRWGVPAIGLMIVVVVTLQIYLLSIGREFDIGGFVLDRDRIRVDSPRYAGVMEDGTTYLLTAQSASAPVNGLDVIDLVNANFLLIREDGSKTTILADTARIDTLRQWVMVDSVAHIDNSGGIKGTMEGMFIDWKTQAISATGAVHLIYPNGMVVDAVGMAYDPSIEQWIFNQSAVQLTRTPGAKS